MKDTRRLAARLRQARDDMEYPPTNREIATSIGVSPPVIDRMMKGQGSSTLGTLDAVARLLKVPVAEARRLRDMPGGDDGPYVAPDESRLLTPGQRTALTALIRSFVVSDTDRELAASELLDDPQRAPTAGRRRRG